MRRVIVAFLLPACTGDAIAPDAQMPPSREHVPAWVSITQTITPSVSTQIYAAFENGTPLPPKTPIGDCVYESYIIDRYPRTFDAGVITVVGSSERIVPKRRDSFGELFYELDSKAHDFADDQLVGVSSSGATVPAFATVIPMPAVAKIVRTPSTVKLDQPLELSWAGGSGIVWFSVSDGGEWISCPFRATAGKGVISPETLAKLRPGKGYLWSSTRNETTLPVGPWDVRVYAQNQSEWQDGGPVDIPITVE